MTGLAAITVRPPWSTAIALGAKLVENRGREIRYRGPIAIHAGLRWSSAGAEDPRIRDLFADRATDLWPANGVDRIRAHRGGHVVAVAELVDCHESDTRLGLPTCCQPWGDSWYTSGPAWHLVLADVRCLPSPVRATGALSVPWTLPADVADQVAEQLRVAADA